MVLKNGAIPRYRQCSYREGYEHRNGEQFKEMTLNLCVLTPDRIVWDSEVKEIILSINSGQIGVLPNHALIATSVNIGNNEITVLVNNAEKSSDTDPHEAQQTLEIAEASLRKEGKRQTIKANLAL
ncbi:hypothetical protein LguiB_032213 [Lonicera macranthoides]